MDHKTDSERTAVLRAYAEGRVHHLNRGLCPDIVAGLDSRDPDCPVCASLAASAGSEPVAAAAQSALETLERTHQSLARQLDLIAERAPGNFLDKRPVVSTLTMHQKRTEAAAVALRAALATRPSPPEGAGWTKASEMLPHCRDGQLYIGVTSTGFAGVFNAVTDIDGNVHCHYETAEESIDVMSGLDVWKVFVAPPASEAKEA